MKIILEELGAVGQLELFRVQLAERLRCDVKRIVIEQICHKPGEEFDSFVIGMAPIDNGHLGIEAKATFSPETAYDVLHNLADDMYAVREQLQFAEVDSAGRVYGSG